jgi:hypothetical protein
MSNDLNLTNLGNLLPRNIPLEIIMQSDIIPVARLSLEEQSEYQEKSLKLLEEIRNNTANLITVVDLITKITINKK